MPGNSTLNPDALRLLQRLLSLGPGDPGYRGRRAHRRLRVLFLLLQGWDESSVARDLKVTRQAINHQSRKFRGARALRLGVKQPHRYEPGSQLAVAIAAAGADHGGWSRCRGPVPVARVHALQLTARVAHRATKLPLPATTLKEWTAGRRGETAHRMFNLKLRNGRSASWVLAEGPRKQAVTIHLSPLFAGGADALQDAAKLLRAEVTEALAVLEGRHGFTFMSWRWANRPEFAFPAPGMAGLVGARNDAGFWDRSLGIPEVETTEFTLALAEARRRESCLFGGDLAQRGLAEAILDNTTAEAKALPRLQDSPSVRGCE